MIQCLNSKIKPRLTSKFLLPVKLNPFHPPHSYHHPLFWTDQNQLFLFLHMLFHLQEGYYLFREKKKENYFKKTNRMLYFQNQVQFSRTSNFMRISENFTESKTQNHKIIWVKRDPWHSLDVTSTMLEPTEIHLQNFTSSSLEKLDYDKFLCSFSNSLDLKWLSQLGAGWSAKKHQNEWGNIRMQQCTSYE